MNMPSCFRMSLDVLGKVWALPVTAVGLVYGLSGYLAGWLAHESGRTRLPPAITFGNNAIQFLNNPLTIRRRAITLGNCICYGKGSDPHAFGAYGDRDCRIGLHEKAHTYQYQVLGPLFIPAYFLLGGFSGPAGNPFERAAQCYAKGEGGWWPRA